MTLYAYRAVTLDDQPIGWVGIAYAPDLKSLFWMIDKDMSPLSVEVKVLSPGLLIAFKTKESEESPGMWDLDLSPSPLSETATLYSQEIWDNSQGWKEIDWEAEGVNL